MGFPSVRHSWSCLRFLGGALFYLSLLGFAASIGLAGWTYYLLGWLGVHLNLAVPGEGYLFPATVGLATLFVAPVHVLGLAARPRLNRDFCSRAALRRSPNCGKSLDRLLFAHVVLSCLSGFLIMGACAGGAFFWGYSRRRVRQGLQRAVRRYPIDAYTRLRFDGMQIELHCCGVDSYTDWFHVPWTATRLSLDSDFDDYVVVEDKDEEEDELEENEPLDYVEEPELIERRLNDNDNDEVNNNEIDYNNDVGSLELVSIDVPFSCCSTAHGQSCIHHDTGFSGTARRNHEPGSRWTVSAVGCYPKLLARAENTGRDILACLLLLSAYQLTLSILSRLLQTARMSAVRVGARGDRFVGWIFGRCGTRRRQRRRQTTTSQRLRFSGGDDNTDDSGSTDESSSTSTSSTSTSCEIHPRRRGGSDSRTAPTCAKQQDEDEDEDRCCCPKRIGKSERRSDINRECGGGDEVVRAKPPAQRNLNSTDVYGRFRGTLQDTLERRQSRPCPSLAKPPVTAGAGRDCQPERSCLTKHSTSSSSSTSSSCSSCLPPLPTTPSRSRKPPQRCRTQAPIEQRSGRRKSSSYCPVHNRYVVHPVDERRRGQAPLAEPYDSSCPVHGHVNFAWCARDVR